MLEAFPMDPEGGDPQNFLLHLYVRNRGSEMDSVFFSKQQTHISPETYRHTLSVISSIKVSLSSSNGGSS